MNNNMMDYNDLYDNIHTLARIQARCFMKLDAGKCTEETCRKCSTNRKLMLCYNQLTPCDQLKLDDESKIIFGLHKQDELEAKIRKKKEKKKMVATILFSILSAAFIVYGWCF